MRPITEIAFEAGIPGESLIPYGAHFAKVRASLLHELKDKPDGRLIIVTAMSPTPAGEGKTTLTIGLTQALRSLGKKAFACIRQPSIGPLLGAKGGATGSGSSRVEPAEEIALHFTGDDYAVSTSHNLVSSLIDNHIYHGNSLNMEKVLWKRVSPINDRSLRKVRIGLGKAAGEREEEFHISAASELMAILSLSADLADLKERVSRTIVALGKDGSAITVRDLKASGATAALLKDALNPNLAQSIRGAPVFIHTGPFGNISIGCSSLLSAKMALKLGEYVITEAGFSTELGAEKFFDIVCRAGGLRPAAAVIVATLGALRLHGGASDYRAKNMKAALKGIDNLRKHIENVAAFGLSAIVALNRYKDDTDEEIDETLSNIRRLGCMAVAVDARDLGAPGGIEAAEAVVKACSEENDFNFLYPLDLPIEEKVSTIARSIYGAEGAVFSAEARADLERIERLGLSALPVCIAKTPKSLSDDPALLGRPNGFNINVREVRPATGAGYVVAVCGNVLLMPGMPEHPLAEEIDIDASGRITGIR